jgi:hypothetical protein
MFSMGGGFFIYIRIVISGKYSLRIGPIRNMMFVKCRLSSRWLGVEQDMPRPAQWSGHHFQIACQPCIGNVV